MLCYSKGKRFSSANFIFFILPTDRANWGVGLTVSHKVGGAVQRNRIKRLLREFFRLHQKLIPQGLNLVVVAKNKLDVKKICFSRVESEILSFLTGLFKNKVN